MGQWEIYNILEKEVPEGMTLGFNDMSELEINDCGVYFNQAYNPIKSTDSTEILQDSLKVTFNIRGGASKDLIISATKWCEATRKTLSKLNDYIYYKLDDDAPEDLKDIIIPDIVKDKLEYLKKTLIEGGYIGKVDWMFIDHFRLIGNVVSNGKNKQGMCRYSVNSIVLYSEGTVEIS